MSGGDGAGRLRFASRLQSPAAEVWAHATSVEGINEELLPFMRMTASRALRALDADDVPVGVPLGHSWVLAFSVLPIDRMNLRLSEFAPGHRFVETSSMVTQRSWRHERTVEPDGGGGCVLTDRVTFEPRLRFALPLIQRVLAFQFRHRHARLQRRFGGVSQEPGPPDP